MNKIIQRFIFIIFTAIAGGLFAVSANAQMMSGFLGSSADWSKIVEHTLLEEQEGGEIWKKFQAKELVCENFDDERYGVLGEYFMGVMTGDSHPAMNATMIQMHGKDGEEQIHITMGKRLSGCDTSASVAGVSDNWMSVVQGGWSSSLGINNQLNNSMMNFGYAPFGGFGWFFMILWWVLIIAGIVVFVRWIAGQSNGTLGSKKSALDILKERYVKGEIDKKEFEEKKKDIE